jgi:DNA-binding NtrC family response regulator
MSDERQGRKLDQCPPALAGRVNLSPRYILLVDDDEAIRNMLQEALELQGYRVSTATTAQEADHVLQQQGPDIIGLVITDIHLTDDHQVQEGYALYEHWILLSPSLPFLLISGAPSSQTLPAIQSGAVPFLAKPFTLKTLLDIVQALFRP